VQYNGATSEHTHTHTHTNTPLSIYKTYTQNHVSCTLHIIGCFLIFHQLSNKSMLSLSIEHVLYVCGNSCVTTCACLCLCSCVCICGCAFMCASNIRFNQIQLQMIKPTHFVGQHVLLLFYHLSTTLSPLSRPSFQSDTQNAKLQSPSEMNLSIRNHCTSTAIFGIPMTFESSNHM